MQEEDYTIIDQYLQGELPDEERAAFEQRVTSDEEFAAELELREQMHTYLRASQQEAALKAALHDFGEIYFSEGEVEKTTEAKVRPLKDRRWVIGLAAAAIIAVLLVVWNPLTRGSLYDQYAEHPPLALVERGTLAELAEEAQTAYQTGDFEAAYPLLQQLAAQREDAQVQLALGIAALETGQTAEAETQFRSLAEGTSALKNYGSWYLGLSRIKAGDEAAARPWLEQIPAEETDLYTKAQALLQEI